MHITQLYSVDYYINFIGSLVKTGWMFTIQRDICMKMLKPIRDHKIEIYKPNSFYV